MPAPAPIRRLCLVFALVACAGAASGCGEAEEVSGLTRVGGGPLVEFSSLNDEVSLRHPRGWIARNGLTPQVAQVGTGGALVSVFAYPRDDIPEDEAEVDEARDKLIRSLGDRAPGFLVLRTRIGEVDGAPSVEVRGRGTIAGKPVESRTLHVYKEEVEWVVDAYARPSQFDRANRIGFGPMFASLDLSDSVVPDGTPGEGG